jgi:hypothetical protein
MTTPTIRVGLDTTRCTPALRVAVEHGAGTLTISGPSIGRRVFRYRDVPTAEDAVEALPLGRLMRHQWDLEDRHALDMMRVATGIETWLVVRGDLAEQYQPDGGPGGTPVSVAA